MDRRSSDHSVVVLADADDAGVARLVDSLSRRLEVNWWRFGVPETSVSVHTDAASFRLEQPGCVLTSGEMHDVPVVVHRRRLLQARPLVVSRQGSAADRGFSEREWASLIDGLLLAAERSSGATWLNPPSASLVTSNKLSLLLGAASAGLPIPAFSVSTPVQFPDAPAKHLVTKAISSDERIDAKRYFSTAVLSDEDLRRLPGQRLPTPSLVQRYVEPELELRVFYVLGECLALALTPSFSHVDIRHSPREELAPRHYELPQDLCGALRSVAKGFALNYCTFDLLLPREGSAALIDITPNGDWDHYESDDAPVVTEFIGRTIVEHVESGRATGD